MTLEELKESILDFDYEDVVLFENFDYTNAFIGISESNQAVYSFDKMVDCLVREQGMEEIEAIEYIEFNTIRSLPYYDNAPIIMYSIF